MLKSYLSTTRVGSFSLFTLQPLAGRGVRTDFQARSSRLQCFFLRFKAARMQLVVSVCFCRTCSLHFIILNYIGESVWLINNFA